MSLNLKKLINRARNRTLGRNLRNTATITLRWDNGVQQGDVNDMATWTGVPDPQTSEVKGLVYFPSAASLINRGFLELVEGDCIVDFDPSLQFAGKQNLTFLIDGFSYVQKTVGKQVMDYYDLLVGGERMFRTCVLTRTAGLAAMGQGVVRYVDAEGSADLYAYDFESLLFDRSGDEDARLTIAMYESGYPFRITINGTLALAVETGGRLLAHAFTLEADLDLDLPSPRIEFVTDTGILATLGEDGMLIARGFYERDTQPQLAPQFTLLDADSGWLATLGRDGVTARALADELP